MEQGVWRYGAQVIGVKKRCRKVERHISADGTGHDLAQTADKPDPEFAKKTAEAWILEHMKSVKKAYATATFWVDDGKGSMTWQPFNDEHNLKWEI